MEFDRDGQRYDQTLAANPELRNSMDGDYHRSNWDHSGVVEADCFVCHLPEYSFVSRTKQLKKQNFRWAAVAGSGIAQVAGAVSDGQAPTVQYNERFFNADGTIALNLSWPPPDENCTFCHSQSDVKKRGFSWNDIHNPDVHQQQGMNCVACHPAGLDHQIAKGDENIGTVRDDLDNTMMTCGECHEAGHLGATVPRHAGIRPSHLRNISCEACHIPKLNRSAGMGFEASSGKLVYITQPPGHKKFGELAEWRPMYERREDGKVYPLNPILAVYFANRDADGTILPLFAREHKKGYEKYKDQLTDDNGDGKPEINTEVEIRLALETYAQTLQGNQRFAAVHPILMKGGYAYEINEAGELVHEHHAMAHSHGFSINHNVAPAPQALGANGCQDCHSPEAHFFKGFFTVDLYDEEGDLVQERNGRLLGCNPWIFSVNSFHQRLMSPMLGLLFMVVLFFIILHYHAQGPKHHELAYAAGEVKRFSVTERLVHLFRLVAFLLLALTGLIFAFSATNWLELFFSSYEQALQFHIGAGVVFALTTIWGTLLWFRDALFAAHDKDWFKKLGGYLGHKGEVPAGRFNAGQKIFYWITVLLGGILIVTGLMLVFKESLGLATVCLTDTIHNVTAFILIAGVVAHAYLGTIANPGTWQILVHGMVSRLWAKYHHPDWYRELKREGRVKDEPGDEI